MSGNCVCDMAGTQSPCKCGTVDRVWALTFTTPNALLKTISVLTEIVKETGPFREFLEVSVCGSCPRSQLAGQRTDVDEVFG
jgi:hypothetical protein